MTFTKHPRCERNKLLRTLHGGAVVVSSAALYEHLGGEQYADFIRFQSAMPKVITHLTHH